MTLLWFASPGEGVSLLTGAWLCYPSLLRWTSLRAVKRLRRLSGWSWVRDYHVPWQSAADLLYKPQLRRIRRTRCDLYHLDLLGCDSSYRRCCSRLDVCSRHIKEEGPVRLPV